MAMKRQPDARSRGSDGCSDTAVDATEHNQHRHPEQPNSEAPGDGISDREREAGNWGSSAADGSIPSDAELRTGESVPRVTGPQRTPPAPGRSRPDR